MTTQTSTPISTETTESTATETVTNGTEPATAVAIEAESPLNGAMPKAEPNGAQAADSVTSNGAAPHVDPEPAAAAPPEAAEAIEVAEVTEAAVGVESVTMPEAPVEAESDTAPEATGETEPAAKSDPAVAEAAVEAEPVTDARGDGGD